MALRAFIFWLAIGFYATAHSQGSFMSSWDNGFKLKSEDGNFSLQFGGRMMYDFTAFSQDQTSKERFGPYGNGVEFRRVRFFNSGTVYSNFSYKLDIDFSGNELSLKDAYMEIENIPVLGKLRLGLFKEPYRLEVLCSSKYLHFMERSPGVAFTPERNTGLMIHNQTADNKLNWQLALFRQVDESGNDTNAENGFVIGSRIAGIIPLKEDFSSSFVHWGVSFNHRNPVSEKYAISSRPETHIGPKLLSTGAISEVGGINMYGLESALVSGAFSAQLEYIHSGLSRLNGLENINFSSYYGELSYFLTGESRRYKFKDAFETFDRIKPNKNAGKEGSGAWQLALRYSHTDLDDQTIAGGTLSDISIGLNWYLNPVARIMAGYIFADAGERGSSNIVQMRMQVDF